MEIKEFESLVDGAIGESHAIEFKGSVIIDKNKSGAIAKEVCAFANSAGGEIYFGIAEVSAKAASLDGGAKGREKVEWLEMIIAQHIKPTLVGVLINSLETDTGWYYKITVPKSSDAPHQSEDNKYYKRSGTHSLPMEHYEIEDVRLRSAIQADPLDLRIVTEQSSLAVLRVENVGPITLKNVSIELRVDFTNDEDIPTDIKNFSKLNYSFLHQETVHRNWLGQFHQFYSGESKTRLLNFDVFYETPGGMNSKTVKFDLNDYSGGLLERSEVAAQLKEVVVSLKSLATEQKKISKSLSAISQAFEPSGVRIAHISLKQLSDNPAEISQVDPLKVGAIQVAEILGLPDDQTKIIQKFLTERQFRREEFRETFKSLSAQSKLKYLKFFDDPLK